MTTTQYANALLNSAAQASFNETPQKEPFFIRLIKNNTTYTQDEIDNMSSAEIHVIGQCVGQAINKQAGI